jgi:predicted metal-dependent peptidase
MNEERKLQKCKIALMRNSKFALLQGVMMIGKTRIADIPSACTNGRDEIYGREFVKKLSERELQFVIAHECSHKMYRHLTTWRKLHDEDHRLANMACDYVINLMLKDVDPTEQIIAMPRFQENTGSAKKGDYMGLLDEQYRGMNAKQVFDILKDKKEKGEKPFDGDGDGDGFDEHDWDGANGMTDEEKKVLAREVDQAIRQGLIAQQKVKGDGSLGLSRELEELLEPKVDWREVLREFVKATCSSKDTSSWRRVNRRFLSTGTYMPSMIGEKVGHLVIGIDTSGSIGGSELAEFLSEVKCIAEEVTPNQVDLIYWDSEVCAHEIYTESTVGTLVESTQPAGGGGTSPSCVSDYLNTNKIVPEAVIMLTDGYVGDDWGNEWTAPVMWTIVGGNDVIASNGKTIHVND